MGCGEEEEGKKSDQSSAYSQLLGGVKIVDSQATDMATNGAGAHKRTCPCAPPRCRSWGRARRTKIARGWGRGEFGIGERGTRRRRQKIGREAVGRARYLPVRSPLGQRAEEREEEADTRAADSRACRAGCETGGCPDVLW